MPDLNGMPSSPRPQLAARRSSQQMPPPAGFVSPTPNVLPSNQSTVNSSAPAATSASPQDHAATASTQATTSPIAADEGTAAASGPGPLRHPRPLTAAQLHLAFEKEGEGMINRLTRELDVLRTAQNPSVASSASSTSASISGSEAAPGIPEGRQHLLSGSGFSIPSAEGRRHDRSSSINSTRSLVGSTPGLTTGSASVVDITAPAPIRPQAVPISRQNSMQSHLSRHSRTGSPLSFAPGSLSQSYSHIPNDASHHGPSYFHRGQQQPQTPGSFSQAELSPGLMPATSRYEETALYRSQLETVTRENEGLKRRIRELERMVRDRRASDASRPRSESVSTTASISAATAAAIGHGIAAPRDSRVMSQASSVAVGVPDDEVRVGESAFTHTASAARRDAAAVTEGGNTPTSGGVGIRGS